MIIPFPAHRVRVDFVCHHYLAHVYTNNVLFLMEPGLAQMRQRMSIPNKLRLIMRKRRLLLKPSRPNRGHCQTNLTSHWLVLNFYE